MLNRRTYALCASAWFPEKVSRLLTGKPDKMSALEGGIVKYMFNRERGRKPLKKNVLDTALTIGEEKAAIPVKNQVCASPVWSSSDD